MSKRTIYIVIFVTLVILGGVVYAALIPRDKVTSPSQTTTFKTETVKSTPPKQAEAGVYVDYSSEKVAASSGTKLLFFYAPWCPQCRQVDNDIKENGLPNDVTVFKVDYDSNQTLRQKYGVTIQTTFVKIDDSGDKIDSYVSYQEPKFSAVERELLP